MFDTYVLNRVFEDADEVVSIAKMKNHVFMGITLTMKNLFGLPPMIPPEGRTFILSSLYSALLCSS